MATEIVVGIIAGIAGVAGAIIGFLGKRDETKQNASEALITGQASRIDRLETRLDSMEAALRETRNELHAIQSHAGDLRDALRRALAWIAETLEHQASPDAVAAPPAPDIDTWQALVDTPPRARNSPK
ncbi:hypothetical protein [Corynebacterium wankanglinii]|uniref:Uncharacterized protein n=1 Tax=Corynebacterium wankanglinii TaxID=2735136 RepID=A0A838CK79_9CORY|nr:hypothetical protein [Corynebacterium wankanglinii]MBA1835464.1 hypothetical protein [Corynebacterium wankanglinii]